MYKRIISIIISLVLAVSLVIPGAAVFGASPYETAVSLDSVALADWMSAIRGETKITELTVPGTHDSCARKFANEDAFGIMSGISKCQSMNITEQLNNGIRYLDIRCEVDPDTLSVKTVHGSTDCWNGNDYYYLDFCFQDIYNWLDAHPSETVFVCIKEDDGDVGAPKFTTAIYEYIHGYGQGKYFYGDSYNYNDYWYLGKSVPTLDTVRGKCVLFNRFDRYIASSGSNASEEESGQKVKWGTYEDASYVNPCYVTDQDWSSGAKYHVQDHYKWVTADKITATQDMLSLGHYRGEYYINYSSTVSDSSVPNPQNLAGKINAAIPDMTFDLDKPSGIFAMDFATGDLARLFIKNNEAVSNLVTGSDGNISYTLNRINGTLTVSGSGAMNNYAPDSAKGVKGKGTTAPWSDQLKNCLFDGQYNTDIVTKIVVENGVTSIGDYAFYGFDNVTQLTLPDGSISIGTNAVPENVSTDYYSLDAKASSLVKESENPFAGADLSSGATISFSKYCESNRGWNTALLSFSSGYNTDNRYFVIMANGTVLFNDGNGGAGGNNGCYFDINSSAEVDSTANRWVDIDITLDRNSAGEHILKYYIDKVLAKTYNLNSICASGYPNGIAGNDGVFSYLADSRIKLYYGASFSIYGTMAGTADSYLDRAEYFTYAKSDSEIASEPLSSVYFNSFTDSLGGTAHTGTEDGGYSVYLQQTDNNGRSGTAYFPYSGTGASSTNYIDTEQNPFSGADLSQGATISFWQRINGNYYDNRESLTFASGEIGENKYFTVGTDGYIRFNNGNEGSDASLNSAGLYFDHTVAEGSIVKQQWQFITLEVIDDYHFRLYVNGRLKQSVTVTGTSQYQSTGGLMSFLQSASTKMYLGSYTPYWGTCTLSLDNIYCFDRALTDGEVYSLYLNETAYEAPALSQDFSAMPEVYSGRAEHLEYFASKRGVLHIAQESADGDISISLNGSVTTDTAHIAGSTPVTVTYTGNDDVVKWIKVTDSSVTEEPSESKVYSFEITKNTSVFCVTRSTEEADISALEAAIEYADAFDGADYSQESFNNLQAVTAQYAPLLSSNPTQAEADNAAYNVLTAVSELVPYLILNVSGENAEVSVDIDGTVNEAGVYSKLFGTVISLSAAAANNGARFIGWYEIDTCRFMSTQEDFTFILTSNTSLKAIYTNSDSSTLTFKNSSGWVKATITKTVDEWSLITSLEPLLPELPYEYTGTNGRWVFDNGEILSKLIGGEDAAITAVFDSNGKVRPSLPSAVNGVPELSLYLDTDSENNVGTFIMAAGIPEGLEIESVGIAVIYKKAGTDLSSVHVTLNNKTLTSKFEPSASSDYYILDVNSFSNYSWALRGYVTYYENGTLKTAYSNQINI